MNYIVTILAMVAVGAYAAPSKRNNEQACGSKPAELFFLLDSSSSIWGLDFKKQLVFVNDVIDSFTIGPNATRVGVASFSYGYYPNFDLDAYDNKDDIKAAVSGIRHKLGGTYTYDALDGVRTRGLSKDRSRPGVARILVVLTDGESHNERKTKEAAMKLKDDGVVVFAVGIGSNTDKVELEAIASEPKEKYLFEVTGYGLLETIKESLFIKACEIDDAPAGPACGLNNPADIMFLVDPAEIGAAHTSVVFDYISELLPEFNMEKDHIRVGVESQNCGAKSIPLGFYEDKSKMEKVLRNSQVSGLAHMLKRLRTHSYRPENGGRDYARHMAVLFVDDKLYDSKTILDEAKRSKNYDVEIFVVAIGDSVVDDELTTLCSSTVNRHLIRVPSYADLKSSKPEFLEKFCQGCSWRIYAELSTKNTEQVCSSKSAELFFLLDPSYSIYALDFRKQLKFVNDVIDSFTIGSDATRVGVDLLSNGKDPDFKLDTYDNKDAIKKAVSLINQTHDGKLDMHDALNRVGKVGLSKDMTRPGVAKILVVLTDSQSNDVEKTRTAAMKLKGEEGVVVFVIGIGRDTNVKELEAIASEPKEKYLLEPASYEELKTDLTYKNHLVTKACEDMTPLQLE